MSTTARRELQLEDLMLWIRTAGAGLRRFTRRHERPPVGSRGPVDAGPPFSRHLY